MEADFAPLQVCTQCSKFRECKQKRPKAQWQLPQSSLPLLLVLFPLPAVFTSCLLFIASTIYTLKNCSLSCSFRRSNQSKRSEAKLSLAGSPSGSALSVLSAGGRQAQTSLPLPLKPLYTICKNVVDAGKSSE